MILVTRAVGNIGSLVVRELKDRGAAIRAFVRDLRRASSKLGDDIELVPGDFAERERIRHALEGIDSVFLACGNGPRQVELETNVIEEASAAGVSRIVKLSAAMARVGSPLAVADWHGQIEESLTASGLLAVILRPGFFMSNLLASVDQVRRTASSTLPLVRRGSP